MWNVLFCNPGFHYTRDYYYLSILRRFTIQTKIITKKKLCLSGAVELRNREGENKRQRQSKSRNEGKNTEQWLAKQTEGNMAK